MRTVVIVFGLVCLMGAIRAQNVGIGTSTPDPTARLDVSDTQRGILIPRLTTEDRDNITDPANSLLLDEGIPSPKAHQPPLASPDLFLHLRKSEPQSLCVR